MFTQPLLVAEATGRIATVDRHATAIARDELSRPVAAALADGLLPPGTSVFDYGCGRGDDVSRLISLGYDACGWDPVHRPHTQHRSADVVNLGYVINVIEDPEERVDVLRAAWELTRKLLVVAARPEWESRGRPGRPFRDGILTERGTFQKFYTQEELRIWIDGTLGVRCIAAAPGIFYVFRHQTDAQSFLAARVRHQPLLKRSLRLTEALYQAHRELLEPLVAFVEARGRLPAPFEIEAAPAIKNEFGSVRAALAVVRRVTGHDAWRAAEAAATQDLAVYLALAAFGGRPKFNQLPEDLQVDVKTFFGSYKIACAEADTLLFRAGDQRAIDRACDESQLGKRTIDALYVHVSFVNRLSPLLRVYEGCGRALTGTVDNATLVKLGRIEPKITYLVYPEFDRDPHPALACSIRADLRHLHVKFRDFRVGSNPPVLHRKETFVADDYPGRDKFARLTAQEERLGLLADSSRISTRAEWSTLVRTRALTFRGHRLIRADTEVRRPEPTTAATSASITSTSAHAATAQREPKTRDPIRPPVERCRHSLDVRTCGLCRS